MTEPSRERMEIMALARGPKGEQGTRGPRGPVRTVAYLFILCFLLIVVVLVYVAHEQQAIVAAQKAIAQESRTNNQQRCASIAQIAAIPVPQPVAGNPSRMWESRYEAIQVARGRQLGCRIGGRP